MRARSMKIHGHKNEMVGLYTGLYDKDKNPLYSGDEIFVETRYGPRKCIVLWDRWDKRWRAMCSDSLWYNDLKKYESESYGMRYELQNDHCDRMLISKIL